MLARRSWRWLRARILGLLTVPPVYLVNGEKIELIPQTRVGYALNPPGRE